jgi:hypothetical protein
MQVERAVIEMVTNNAASALSPIPPPLRGGSLGSAYNPRIRLFPQYHHLQVVDL